MAKQGTLKREDDAGKSRAEEARSRDKLRGVPEEADAHRHAANAADLDRLIHERIRLAIVSALAVNDTLTFSDLREMLKTTDGNLSVHARKLEEAGYVLCTKSFEGRLPKTEYRLSSAGRRALEHYLNHMEALIRAARRR